MKEANTIILKEAEDAYGNRFIIQADFMPHKISTPTIEWNVTYHNKEKGQNDKRH